MLREENKCPQARPALMSCVPEFRCPDESCLIPEERKEIMACQPQTGRKQFLNSMEVRVQSEALSIDPQTLCNSGINVCSLYHLQLLERLELMI